MLNLIVTLLTLLSIFLIIYHHAGYPLLLRYLRSKSASAAETDDFVRLQREPERLPSVTIVVPAYNEEAFIADKIRNLAILDYPQDRLQIIVASDGSMDATYEIASTTALEPECRHLSIQVVRFEENQGKVAVLNRLIDAVDSDIVALSDVSAMVSIDALLIAADQFSDPQVGVVNGRYRLLNPGSEGEKKYWDYQSNLKAGEASLGSVIGSHGAFYLIRRELYQHLPTDTINDDFIIPMRIVMQGYRSVYSSDILALEMEQSDTELDNGRRHRIAAGNLQQMLRLKTLLLPRYRGTAFTFASGKCLRVLMPYLMILALAGSVFLATEHPVFLILSFCQILGYMSYLAMEVFRIGDSVALLQTFKYLMRGHANNFKGSLAYMRTALFCNRSRNPGDLLAESQS